MSPKTWSEVAAMAATFVGRKATMFKGEILKIKDLSVLKRLGKRNSPSLAQKFYGAEGMTTAQHNS